MFGHFHQATDMKDSSNSMTSSGESFVLTLREFSGSLGDMGTLLPLMLGAIAIAGMAPGPVLLGFALFYLFTAGYYRLPIPVQPMKAVAAALLTAGLAPSSLAAAGVIMGITLLVLGLTGWISKVARLVPQSVLAGLQLGLGIMLGTMSLGLMASAPWVAGATLVLLVGLMTFTRWPAVFIALLAATGLAYLLGESGVMIEPGGMGWVAVPSLPSISELHEALFSLVLPQLSLTFTNAILLTALLASDHFGDRAAHVTPARLSVTSGLANTLLTPLGAFPMCHGAGGVTAHYRFGARSGGAPLMLGLLLLGLVVLPGNVGLTLLSSIPMAGLGALLLVTAWQLAITKRLFDCRASCVPVIVVTAALTVWVNPFWGLLAGGVTEWGRKMVLRRLSERTA